MTPPSKVVLLASTEFGGEDEKIPAREELFEWMMRSPYPRMNEHLATVLKRALMDSCFSLDSGGKISSKNLDNGLVILSEIGYTRAR